jgi:hypothetical protein
VRLVVAGNVRESVSILADNILHMFVGGSALGEIRSNGSCQVWVEGDLRGEIWTGMPVTRLRVRGDCTASLRPSTRAALLYLEVDGTMSSALLDHRRFQVASSTPRSGRATARRACPDRTTNERLRRPQL